ncbi:PEP-CTERM sorting domain-containing protein [Pontiella sp.]|uniref:PEP-CTERM sorting domain-containing protein n=1 Tax=Pontiella sp. TaxID=2837462 RepID=UPI00356B593D
MKTVYYLLTAGLLMVGGVQAATIQGNDGEWNDTGTWNVAYLPGATEVDTTILASGDNVTVTSAATYATNNVNLNVRAGATLDISADMTVMRNMFIGDAVSSGATVTQTAGTIDRMSSTIRLGTQSTSMSTYTISGSSVLDFNGNLDIGPMGLFKVVGDNVTISAGNQSTDTMTMTDAGELEFVLGATGASAFTVAGDFTVDSVNSQLTVDGSGYTGGEADITLVNAATMTGTFAAGKYNVTGMGVEGTDWTLTQGTNGDLVLNVIPEPATLGLIAAFGGGLLFIRRFIQI